MKNRRCVLYMIFLWLFLVSFLLLPPSLNPPVLSFSSPPAAAAAAKAAAGKPAAAAAAAADWGLVSVLQRLLLGLLLLLEGLREELFKWLGLVALQRLLQLQLLLLSACNCCCSLLFELFVVRRCLQQHLQKQEATETPICCLPKSSDACELLVLSASSPSPFPSHDYLL